MIWTLLPAFVKCLRLDIVVLYIFYSQQDHSLFMCMQHLSVRDKSVVELTELLPSWPLLLLATGLSVISGNGYPYMGNCSMIVSIVVFAGCVLRFVH